MAYSRWHASPTLRRLFGGLVAIALVAGACSSTAATPTPAPPATATAAAVTSAPATPTAASVSFDLKYGILMSFTGAVASAGPSWDHTVRLAISTIDQDLKTDGLASQIKLDAFTQDDGSSTTTGVEAANLLVKADGVSAILGPCCSGVTVAVAQGVTIPAGVPMFTIGSSPSISALQSNGTVFRTTPSDAIQGQAVANLVVKDLGQGKTVNVGAENDAYGQGLESVFVPAYEALGGKIGVVVNYNPTQATFDTEAQKLTSNNPDGTVFFAYTGDFANMRAALERTGKFNSSTSFGADSLICAGSETGAECGTPGGMRGTSPSVSSGAGDAYFLQVWNANKIPNVVLQGTFEQEGWDAAFIVFLAALDAKSAAPADVVSHIHDVTDPGGTEYTAANLTSAITDLLAGKKIKYVGATGPDIFDAHGDVTTSIFNTWSEPSDGVTTVYTGTVNAGSGGAGASPSGQ